MKSSGKSVFSAIASRKFVLEKIVLLAQSRRPGATGRNWPGCQSLPMMRCLNNIVSHCVLVLSWLSIIALIFKFCWCSIVKPSVDKCYYVGHFMFYKKT